MRCGGSTGDDLLASHSSTLPHASPLCLALWFEFPSMALITVLYPSRPGLLSHEPQNVIVPAGRSLEGSAAIESTNANSLRYSCINYSSP